MNQKPEAIHNPYMFILKEGKKNRSKEDLLDYSLQMFHIGRPEMLISSKHPLRNVPVLFAQSQTVAGKKMAST
jgi:hypothetical protein